MSDKVLRVFWPGEFRVDSRLGRDLRARREKLTSKFRTSLPDLNRMRTRDDFVSILQFTEAVKTFDFGFDVPSIFHSGLAVETVLFIRVADQLGVASLAGGKKQVPPPPFKTLIRLAQKSGIVDDATGKLANDVRLLRNMYVHYYDLMYLGRELSRRKQALSLEVLKEFLRDKDLTTDRRVRAAAANVDRVEAAKNSNLIDKITQSLPILDISPFIEPDTVNFYERRAIAHQSWVLNRLVYDEGFDVNDIQRMILTMGQKDGVYKYDPRMFDALDMLSWSGQVLVRTGTLPAT